jgi:hypothetical protein
MRFWHKEFSVPVVVAVENSAKDLTQRYATCRLIRGHASGSPRSFVHFLAAYMSLMF